MDISAPKKIFSPPPPKKKSPIRRRHPPDPSAPPRDPLTGVLLGPGPESAPRSAFWAILGTCLGVPQRVLFECFLAFFGPKNAKKHSKSTLWGTPRQVPKIAQKALRGALSGPGPKSTPVTRRAPQAISSRRVLSHHW